MSRRFRPLSLILVLVLALASVTLSVARGQAVAVGTGMFCSGQGMVLRAVDANGQPTLAVYPCPDCLAGFGPALLPLPVMAPHRAAQARPDLPPHLISAPASTPPGPQARGPPIVA